MDLCDKRSSSVVLFRHKEADTRAVAAEIWANRLGLCLCRCRAGRAKAIQKELVASQFKSGRNRWSLSRQDTAGKIVDTPAVPAMKMMMMSLSGDLVARRLAGNFNGRQPTVGDERIDIAIHRRNADAFHDALCGRERFVWRKGACSTLKGSANGVFLSCFSES